MCGIACPFPVLRRLLAAGVVLASCMLPLHAWAIDSDGDGVDDSIDAFPNNAEATTDTDGDGKPDSININKLPALFQDSFESGNFTSGGWTLGGTLPGTPWTIYAYGGTQGNVAKLSLTAACGILENPCKYAYMQKTVTVPAGGATLRFDLKGRMNSDYGVARLYVDGSVYKQWLDLAPSSTVPWLSESVTLSSGSHVLKWFVTTGISSGGYIYVDAVRVYAPSTLVEDTDDDNDGVADTADACPLDATASTNNADGDALCDLNDPDDDNDGAPDYLDPEPFNAANSSVWPLNSGYKGSALQERTAVE